MEELTQTERDAVLKLNAEYRRAFFEEKARKNGCFFILADEEGPVVMQDSDGGEGGVIPVFTDQQFASQFASDMKIEGAHAQQVSVEAYNGSWPDMLRQNSMELGFMPVGDEFETGVPEAL
ncbi:MAG: DUF2750 domain-containing protein [Succinivibrio sp.]